MSDFDDPLECPACDFRFVIIWNNDGAGGPEYCPRCGEYIQEIYLEVKDNEL